MALKNEVDYSFILFSGFPLYRSARTTIVLELGEAR
jgi:hypothetical protein